jgi:AcrR family transcriptional regulator
VIAVTPTLTTRQKLIHSAFNLFSRHGFHHVGLDQILTDVGVTKTTFYNHFESRDDLIIAMLKDRDQAQTDSFIKAMHLRAGFDPRRQLDALFDVLGEWFADKSFRGCIFMAAATEFSNPNDPIHQTAIAHNASFTKNIVGLCEAAGAKDAYLLGRQLVLLVNGAIDDFYLMGNRDAGTVAAAAAQRLLAHAMPTRRKRVAC